MAAPRKRTKAQEKMIEDRREQVAAGTPAEAYDVLTQQDQLTIIEQQVRHFEDRHYRLKLDLDAMDGFDDARINIGPEEDALKGQLAYVDHMLEQVRGKRDVLLEALGPQGEDEPDED